jgi:hypothetical protein
MPSKLFQNHEHGDFGAGFQPSFLSGGEFPGRYAIAPSALTNPIMVTVMYNVRAESPATYQSRAKPWDSTGGREKG